MSNQQPKKECPIQKALFSTQMREVGLGGLVGYFSGVYTRKEADRVAYYLGGAFVALQVLAHFGYVVINMKKIEEDVVEKLDVDHDGKITTNDFKVMWEKYSSMIMNKVPSTAVFAVAFLYGFKGRLSLV